MKKRGELFAINGIFLLAGALLVAQLFLLRPDTRSVFTNADLFEGMPGLSVNEKSAQITLETDRPEPGVWVLINGKKQQSFYNKKITISVQEHSLIQIKREGTDRAVSVALTGIPSFVRKENLNLEVGGEEEIFYVGRILFQ